MPTADAILSGAEAPCVGIVTADCLPILVATGDAGQVAAIHAGWRGLAAGVIEAGLAALLEAARFGAGAARSMDLSAAIGPAAGPCCYEVDEPVREGLARRYRNELDPRTLAPGRKSGRYQLDLARLAHRILARNGVKETQIGTSHSVCTICDSARFESHRRDGDTAGRLRHFIVAGKPRFDQG